MTKQREHEAHDYDLDGVDDQGLDDALQHIPIGEPAVVRRTVTEYYFESTEANDDEDYEAPPVPPRRRGFFSGSRRTR